MEKKNAMALTMALVMFILSKLRQSCYARSGKRDCSSLKHIHDISCRGSLKVLDTFVLLW
jgi:hypothetical protein